jgi:hypothetical protein
MHDNQNDCYRSKASVEKSVSNAKGDRLSYAERISKDMNDKYGNNNAKKY